MIIYNVTVKIDPDAGQEWLKWMKEIHVPDVIATKQFISSQICRLLDQPEEDDSTYVIQYRCESREKFDFYIENFAPALRAQHDTRYKGKFVSFRTLMEIV